MAETEGDKKRVMVAVDESECSHYALRWVLQNLGDSISKSELIVFSVQPIANYGFAYASTYAATPPELVASLQENQRKLTAALLERAKQICAEHGITAQTMTEIGDPKSVICEVAEKSNVQLLILGSHSRGVIQRAFLGSVSNYCVHHAKCPVLVVRKTE